MDDAREEASRFVRRKRRFLTVIAVYLALCVFWFAIDMLTGTDGLWFYWPVLGAGLIVAVIGFAMFGFAGLFGPDWERRQIDAYSTATPTSTTARATRLRVRRLGGDGRSGPG